MSPEWGAGWVDLQWICSELRLSSPSVTTSLCDLGPLSPPLGRRNNDRLPGCL